MRGSAHPLLVLLLAPLLLVTVALRAFHAAWTEPAIDTLESAAFAAWVASHCPAEALLVMGAAQYDGLPSGAFERRLAGAARLYREGCAPLVVVSGGQREGDRTSEGGAGVAWLAARGVPTEALLAETWAATSVQNLRHSADLLPVDRWLVVTDDLHAARVRYAAQRLGIDAVVVGVGTHSGRFVYAAREVAGLVAYRLGAFR